MDRWSVGSNWISYKPSPPWLLKLIKGQDNILNQPWNEAFLIILTFFMSFSGTNLPSGSTWNGGIFAMDRWIVGSNWMTHKPQSPLAFKIKKRSGKYCKSALKRGLIILTFFISFSGTNLPSGSTWNGGIFAMDRWIIGSNCMTHKPSPPWLLKSRKGQENIVNQHWKEALSFWHYSYLFQGPICHLDPLGTA